MVNHLKKVYLPMRGVGDISSANESENLRFWGVRMTNDMSDDESEDELLSFSSSNNNDIYSFSTFFPEMFII